MTTPITFRPLGTWTGQETTNRTASPFTAPYSSTLELLDRELRALDANQTVIQIDVSEDAIRLDGRPKANARPEHPGVILTFHSQHGPLRYATDRYRNWKDNLRAIALGLEALRKVSRYGIGTSGEQYTGWRQLTSGTGPTTRDDAITTLASVTNMTPQEVDADWQTAYRRAVKATHPDHTNPFNPELWTDVQHARQILAS